MPATDSELILLGAGASQEAGIPTAKKMLVEIRELLRKQPRLWVIVGRAIDTAIGGLMQYNASLGDPYGEIDVESLFAVLDDLAERGSNTLAPFVPAWSQPVAAAAGSSRDAQVDEVVTQLEADLKNKLRDVQRSAERGRSPSQGVNLNAFRVALRDLFRSTDGRAQDPFGFAALVILQNLLTLCWINDPTKVEYLKPLAAASARKRLWIATLNFDNSIELAAQSAGVGCDLGITGDYRPITFSEDSRLTLAKLHGSVNWSRPDPWKIEVKDSADMAAALIFGAGNKLRVEGPYLDLLLAFRAKLETVDHLTVCGYSFRDEHINHTLVRWLQLNTAARITVYGLDLSAEKMFANLNANLGITMLTKNRVSLPPGSLSGRLITRDMKASEWVRQFVATII
jgi:hypothetical protein